MVKNIQVTTPDGCEAGDRGPAGAGHRLIHHDIVRVVS
jgi:hypothetical protein